MTPSPHPLTCPDRKWQSLISTRIQGVCYHKIRSLDDPRPIRKYHFDIDTFHGHMKMIRQWGLSTIDFGQIVRNSFPVHYNLCITFDDGSNTFLKAAEIMKELEIPGSFFLCREFCETWQDALKPNEIRLLQDNGFYIGSHGVRHEDLTRFRHAHLITDLSDSRKWLEDILGCQVTTLAFPYGHWNQTVLNAAAKAGFKVFASTSEKITTTPLKNGIVNRYVMNRHYPQPLVASIFRNKGWPLRRFHIIRRYSEIIRLKKKLFRSHS